MPLAITGLHHVTAVSADARRNADFYTRVLGLRLVKRTVNFEDERAGHLYYGDDAGRAGTLLTFFVWPQECQGRAGRGHATVVRFAIRRDSCESWDRRLAREGVAMEGPSIRNGRRVVSFADPEGLPLELVEVAHDAAGRTTGAGAAVLGLDSVEIAVGDTTPTDVLFESVMGLRAAHIDESVRGYAAGRDTPPCVTLRATPDLDAGARGAGTVHHVAFRIDGDSTQEAWQSRLRESGCRVSDIKDRTYFRSIYFREPGGTKLELATDAPGFAVDEPAESLGTRLQLPERFEPQRAALERRFGPGARA
jgi:glyoxalase family protein